MSQIRQRKKKLVEVNDDDIDKDPRDNDEEEDSKLSNKNDKDTNKTFEPGTYWFTRILFLRYLGFIYFVAFLVSYNQNKELIGKNGLTPAGLYLLNIGDKIPDIYSRIFHVPSLLWLAYPNFDDIDILLDGIALTGDKKLNELKL